MNKTLEKLTQHTGIKKYFANTSWLFLNQGVRLFVSFFVGLWLARYLGPEKFGLYSYVVSFSAIFMAFAKFGLDELMIKEFIHQSKNELKTLNTGFWLKTTSGLISLVTLCTIAYFIEPNKFERNLIMFASIPLVFQSFEILDAYFKAKVQAKKSSLSRITQLLVSAGLKVYFILTGKPIDYFVYVLTFDSISYAFFIYGSYRRSNKSFIRIVPDFPEIFKLMLKAWPLMIVTTAAMALTKLDQILIANIIGNSSVGIYAASSKILEIFVLFPTLISSSLFPAIINAKMKNEGSYLRRLKKLNILLFWSSLSVSIIIYFFSDIIIHLLFTNSFDDSADILQILVFNLVFISMSLVGMRWYIAENLQKYLMIKSVLLTLFNVGLNLILIPKLGAKGAAYSSIISSFVFYYLFDFIHRKTRTCFYINSSFLNFKNYLN